MYPAQPVDTSQMIAAGFRVSLQLGNLATMRLLLGMLSRPWLSPILHPWLRITRIQPPGCEPAYWLDLRSNPDPTSHQPDVVLCYVHGGAFVAGDPLMCAGTFQRWLGSLARRGLHARVLCISYPLAPERPFPAAVASTAAAFAWAGQQNPGATGTGSKVTSIMALGDSAGDGLKALQDVVCSLQGACSPCCAVPWSGVAVPLSGVGWLHVCGHAWHAPSGK